MSGDRREATGGCSCGEIRYVLSVVPDKVVVCHCADCRRAAGAQSVAWLILSAAGLKFVHGEPASYRSSSDVIRRFCSACGTTLSYQHTQSPERIDITVGSLDDPERFVPTKAGFEAEKLSWASSI